MTDEGLHRDAVCVEEARHLRLIANDLRAAGDIPLVELSEDGVAHSAVTLADELWLIALRLDSSGAFGGPVDEENNR